MPPAAGRPVGIRQPGHRCLPAETVLDRYRAHTLVKGAASPDDPGLARYWADRLLKVKPPLPGHHLAVPRPDAVDAATRLRASRSAPRSPASPLHRAGRGLPARFLYGYQGVPKIDKLALMKD